MKASGFLKGTFSALKSSINPNSKLEKEKQLMQEKIAEAMRQGDVALSEVDTVGSGYRECIEYMEEKMKRAKNGEDRWESSDEEEGYDYGQECEEVFYRRER